MGGYPLVDRARGNGLARVPSTNSALSEYVHMDNMDILEFMGFDRT
jgi:hypothetical protein